MTLPDDACFWCGGLMVSKHHLDHVVPRRLGGPNLPWNLVVSCAPCNTSKGSLWPTKFVRASLPAHLVKLEKWSATQADWPTLLPKRSQEDITEFVAEKMRECIGIEGTFRTWAANTICTQALDAIAERDRFAYPEWVEPDARLIAEIAWLRGVVDHYRVRIAELEHEVAMAHADYVQPWIRQEVE